MNNKFYLIIIGFLVVVILLLGGCHSCTLNKLAKCEGKIITKTDTVYIKEAVTTPVYVPQPYAVVQVKEVPKYITRIVDGETKYLPVDTTEILKDYFSKVVYNDSVSTEHGKVFIKDTITQNRIASRQVTTSLNIPVITKTIIEKRGQVYIGINGQGTKDNYLSAAGLSLMYKTKNDKAIEVGAMYGSNNTIIYQLGLKYKLSFKK